MTASVDNVRLDRSFVGQWCASLQRGEEDEVIMEDVSEVIPREFLNCRLCNDEFQHPKLLPCLHSFCLACIATYIRNYHTSEQHHDQSKSKFPCPECGLEVQTEDAGYLPDNVLARRLSCPSLGNTPRDPADCQACIQQGRGEVPATMCCVNCDENFCNACTSTHRLQEETASHKTVPLIPNAGKVDENTDARNVNDTDESPAVLSKCCQCYDTYDIDSMYCVDCDKALCADCHGTHDETHRCAELSAIAQNFTAKIQGPVDDLRRDSQTLTRMLANLDRTQRYAAKLQRDVQTKVKRRTRVLCGLIREYESVLLQEIERRNEQNMAAIQQRRTAVSQHAASITAVTELTDKLLQFGSEEEKVALRRKVGHRVRELCETDLPSTPLELTNLKLIEPSVTVETICNLFGELRTDVVHPGIRRRSLTSGQSYDSGHASVSESIEDAVTELTELEEAEEESNSYADSDMLSNSNQSEDFEGRKDRLSNSNHSDDFDGRRVRGVQDEVSPRDRHDSEILNTRQLANLPTNTTEERRVVKSNSLDTENKTHHRGRFHSNASDDNDKHNGSNDKADVSNSSFQSNSSAPESIPTQLLETPRRELSIPDFIPRENVKGVGVNKQGDIVVATIATVGSGASSAIYILEQHGIVRGQIAIDSNWNVHSVAADGRVALIVPRGDNRYKVKVMSEDGTGTILVDVHLESFGLNFATATSSGHLLVASNRYAKLSRHDGKAAKSGGNVSVFDTNGRLLRRITNEDLSRHGARLLEKPHWLALDANDNVFVADPASHCVVGFTMGGELLFQLGNSSMESEDLYQGPDSVCVDKLGHVIVTDKKEGRIDVINYQGQLLKSLFPSEAIRFVCTVPDKELMVVTTDGNMKFYDYL